MRENSENIKVLQQKIDELYVENALLKEILVREGISYETTLVQDSGNQIRKDELNPIDFPSKLTDEICEKYIGYFHGRTDVYATRWKSKDGEKCGYSPCCENFWTKRCPRIQKSKIRCSECDNRQFKRLGKFSIGNHLRIDSNEEKDVIGIYPLLEDKTCFFIVFDFDNHQMQENAYENNSLKDEVNELRNICKINSIPCLVERSRSGNGAHLWIFFSEAIPATIARRFGLSLLEKGMSQINITSFQYYDRLFPTQDDVSKKGLGNLVALPLQGSALHKANSAFVDENWIAYRNQFEILFSCQKLTKAFVESKISEWSIISTNIFGEIDKFKPWEVNQEFHAEDIDGVMKITRANGVIIETVNLKARIQNQIRRMVAFQNPIFWKNKGIGKSNYKTSQWIYLGEDYKNLYLTIPRGCYERLIHKIKDANIPYHVDDERIEGKKIQVSFCGELREKQQDALEEMMKHDDGMLIAATSFGKTVVCSAIIAEKKVNTLIVLNRTSLIEQWKDALYEFLDIQEQLPMITTKSGKTKQAKEIIGTLYSNHDSLGGIIDIAMVGSLCKKGEYHELLHSYGMIIFDECHHAAANTYENLLKEARTKYIYGVSASEKRTDKLEKKNFLLVGPVRFRYTEAQQADDSGIRRYVYPRFTRTVSLRGNNQTKNANEAYALIRNNERRNNQIIDDVIEAVKMGRSPIVLSKYVDQITYIAKQLEQHIDNVFLMTGDNSKKQNKEILQKMREVDRKDSLVLCATGGLIGEGFDFPRLDTLFLATPISAEELVKQYTGRLNRNYEGKKDSIVYDYIDRHITMFENSYVKRLKAYKTLKYEVVCDSTYYPETKNAIFDNETYKLPFESDLQNAKQSIVICSPYITQNKMNRLIDLLEKKQRDGIAITIITNDSDTFHIGDSSDWVHNQIKMRENGYYVVTHSDVVEHFAIIDKEIIWYGNMNLLGKISIEDRMMRIKNIGIAEELLESILK